MGLRSLQFYCVVDLVNKWWEEKVRNLITQSTGVKYETVSVLLRLSHAFRSLEVLLNIHTLIQ